MITDNDQVHVFETESSSYVTFVGLEDQEVLVIDSETDQQINITTEESADVYYIENYRGLPGKSNYELATDRGFIGSIDDFLESLIGDSAYEVALSDGFVGTKAEWLLTLVGKSAYDIALDHGFVGTEEEWINTLVTRDMLNEKLNIADFFTALQANINNPLLIIDQGELD